METNNTITLKALGSAKGNQSYFYCLLTSFKSNKLENNMQIISYNPSENITL